MAWLLLPWEAVLVHHNLSLLWPIHGNVSSLTIELSTIPVHCIPCGISHVTVISFSSFLHCFLVKLLSVLRQVAGHRQPGKALIQTGEDASRTAMWSQSASRARDASRSLDVVSNGASCQLPCSMIRADDQPTTTNGPALCSRFCVSFNEALTRILATS